VNRVVSVADEVPALKDTSASRRVLHTSDARRWRLDGHVRVGEAGDIGVALAARTRSPAFRARACGRVALADTQAIGALRACSQTAAGVDGLRTRPGLGTCRASALWMKSQAGPRLSIEERAEGRFADVQALESRGLTGVWSIDDEEALTA